MKQMYFYFASLIDMRAQKQKMQDQPIRENKSRTSQKYYVNN